MVVVYTVDPSYYYKTKVWGVSNLESFRTFRYFSAGEKLAWLLVYNKILAKVC